jgi:hypothetical protein
MALAGTAITEIANAIASSRNPCRPFIVDTRELLFLVDDSDHSTLATEAIFGQQLPAASTAGN